MGSGFDEEKFIPNLIFTKRHECSPQPPIYAMNLAVILTFETTTQNEWLDDPQRRHLSAFL
jgi:hypothetical protein